MRNYSGMRLAPNMGVAQLREEAQRADNYLRHISALMGRMSPAPQGSGPAGGSGGTIVDLNQFWYLPGRVGAQRAYGTNLIEVGVYPAGGLTAPTKPKRGGFFSYDDTKGNANVWLFSEGTAGTHISGYITDRTFYPDRYWVFPAFNQLASGDGGNVHYFVDADSRQLIAGKTLTSWVIETPDAVGTGIVNNISRGENQAGLANALQLTFHGSFPTTTWKYTSNAPSGGSYPSLAFPPLDVNANTTAPNREKQHILAIMRRAHTASTVFEPGGVLMGGNTGRELYPLYTTAQGTLAAPGDNSLMLWHPTVTQSCTMTTSSAIVTMASTTGIYAGMRMRETAAGYQLSEETHVKSVDSPTQITMSQVWPGSNGPFTVAFFGLNWVLASALGSYVDHGTLTGLGDDDHPQYLLLAGRTGTGAQVIGSGAHTGGSDTSLVIEGQLLLGDATTGYNFVNNEMLSVQSSPTTLSGIERGSRVALNLGGVTTISGTPTYRALQIDASGTINAAASGTFNLTGFFFSSSVVIPTGVTCGTTIGGQINANVQTSGGTATNLTGLQVTAQGDASATSGTNLYGIDLQYSNRNQSFTNAHALRISRTGTVGSSLTAFSAIFINSNLQNAATDWYGINIPSIATPTRQWGVYSAAFLNYFGGNISIGSSSPAPTNWLEIAAGTTTKAPIRLTSGTSLTTPVAGAIEFTTDDFFATITTGPARKAFVLDDGTRLTSGRVPFATTNGRLTDDADMTFATDTLTVTKIAATTLTGTLTFADAINVAVGTTTGTKIGTATTQKLGFWNAAPIVQPTTGVTAATFVANTSGIVDDSATWDGYTIGQVVAALRLMGILA